MWQFSLNFDYMGSVDNMNHCILMKKEQRK